MVYGFVLVVTNPLPKETIMRNRTDIEEKTERGEYTGMHGGSDASVGNNTELIVEVLLDIRDLLSKETNK